MRIDTLLPLASLLKLVALTTFPVSAMAQESRFEEAYLEFVHGYPQFAVGASYIVGMDQPVVAVNGPTQSDGFVSVSNTAPWHIGSIGKSITATLVMRLVARGALDLDAPIGRFLPAYRDNMHPDWTSPSLRRLLSHTSGLPVAFPSELAQDIYNHDPKPGRRAALSAMWAEPVVGQVGHFAYSNVGYVLAGLVIEEVTGLSWESAIRMEIAEPLNLTSLGFGAPTEADAPRGHKNFLGLKRSVAPDDPVSDNPRWMGPAGTIHLSLADLAEWGRVHISACKGERPSFLSQSACQEMQTPVSEKYGLGWVILETEEWGHIVSHSGSNTMWHAALYIVPEKDVAVAAASNVHLGEQFEQLARDLTLSVITDLP